MITVFALGLLVGLVGAMASLALWANAAALNEANGDNAEEAGR
jgi:hypothetical protein